jgi:hypothetical protein
MIAVRFRLPQRRASESFELECAGLHYSVTFSRGDSGRVLEVFLQNSKPGSQSDINARDAAVAASLAFQFGCPLKPCAMPCCAIRAATHQARSAWLSILSQPRTSPKGTEHENV